MMQKLPEPASEASVDEERAKMDTPQQYESVAKKLLQILSKKQHGIFSSAVPEYYYHEFRERLPVDWRSRIEGDSRFVKRITAGVIPSADIDILYDNPSSDPPEIPTLKWSATEFRIIKAHVVNAKNFYGTLLSRDVDRLASDMAQFYSEASDPLHLETHDETSVVGVLYAVPVGEKWYRVRCVRKASDSKTDDEYFFVDHGHTKCIPHNRIYHLAREFYSFPCHSVNCRLEGLVDLDDTNLNNPVVIAEVERLLSRRNVRVIPRRGCDPAERPLPVRVLSQPDDMGNNPSRAVRLFTRTSRVDSAPTRFL